jgi:hypothetical protein
MSGPVVVPTVVVPSVVVPAVVVSSLVVVPPVVAAFGIERVGVSLDGATPVNVLAAATPASKRIAEMTTAALVICFTPFE